MEGSWVGACGKVGFGVHVVLNLWSDVLGAVLLDGGVWDEVWPARGAVIRWASFGALSDA